MISDPGATVRVVAAPRSSTWPSIAGAAVGLVVTVVLAAAGPLRLPAGSTRTEDPAGFLAAWERSRRGTFVVRSSYERRRPGGGTLTSPGLLVQRPPDRLVQRLGGLTGTLAGRAVACAADAGGTRCTTSTPAGAAEDGEAARRAYDESLRRSLDTFRDWFAPPAAGMRPRYRVLRETDTGCFDLVLMVAGADAPYGTDARLCFDGPTGAVDLLQRRYEGGIIEVERAEHITTAVTAADLVLPAEPADDPTDPER